MAAGLAVYYRLLKVQSSHRFLFSKNPFCLCVINLQEVLLLWVLPWSWCWTEGLTADVCQEGLLAASDTQVSSRLLLLLQMLCGRVGVFPHALLDCPSLCKPIAARCQFHPVHNELFVLVRSVAGTLHSPRCAGAGLGALPLPSALGSCAPQKVPGP